MMGVDNRVENQRLIRRPPGAFFSEAEFYTSRLQEKKNPIRLGEGARELGWYTRVGRCPEDGKLVRTSVKIVTVASANQDPNVWSGVCPENTSATIWSTTPGGMPDSIIDNCRGKTDLYEEVYDQCREKRVSKSPICLYCINRAIERGRLIQDARPVFFEEVKTAPE